MTEQEQPPKVWTIAEVDAKIKELENRIIDIGIEIMDKLEKGEEFGKELLAEQQMKEKILASFKRISKGMKKDNPGAATGNYSEMLSDIYNKVKDVQLGVGKIQQNILPNEQ